MTGEGSMSILRDGDMKVRWVTMGAALGGILLMGPRLGKAWDHRRVSRASHRTEPEATRISPCMTTLSLRGRHITKEAVTKGMVTKGTVTKVTVAEATVTKAVVTQVLKGVWRDKGDHTREGQMKEESNLTHR